MGQRPVQQKKRLQGEKETEMRLNRDFLLKQMSSQTCQDTKICNQISKHFYFPKETLGETSDTKLKQS